MRASNDPVLTDDRRARRDVPRNHGSGADPRTVPDGDAPNEDRARTDVDPFAEDGRTVLDGWLLARPDRDVVENRAALADAGMTGDDDIVGMRQPEPCSEPPPPEEVKPRLQFSTVATTVCATHQNRDPSQASLKLLSRRQLMRPPPFAPRSALITWATMEFLCLSTII